MTIGAVQSLLICSATAAPVVGFPCPAGKGPLSVDAYLIFPGSSSFFDALDAPFDYSVAAQFWGLSLTTVLTCFLVAYACKQIIKAIN